MLRDGENLQVLMTSNMIKTMVGIMFLKEKSSSPEVDLCPLISLVSQAMGPM